MYDMILELEMNVVWRYGDVVCKAVPLADIDTITESSRRLNTSSVLANVVYGVSTLAENTATFSENGATSVHINSLQTKNDHLDFFDGLIEELLERKWESFGKRR